jgi:hypothetical protein
VIATIVATIAVTIDEMTVVMIMTEMIVAMGIAGTTDGMIVEDANDLKLELATSCTNWSWITCQRVALGKI